MPSPLLVQLSGYSLIQVETHGNWGPALQLFDVSGHPAEAALAAKLFAKCPNLSVREQLLATLSQAQPKEAFFCGARMATLHPGSPRCLESLLHALVRIAQSGELADGIM